MVRHRDPHTGRPPKPLAVLKMEGTYRADRHAGRGPLTGGEPLRKPDCLPDAASWLWEEIYRTRGPWLCGSDAASLRTLCMAFHFMRATETALLVDPTDKLARCAWSGYQAAFSQLGARFGLTPSDRARLGEDKPQRDADNELEAMLC